MRILLVRIRARQRSLFVRRVGVRPDAMQVRIECRVVRGLRCLAHRHGCRVCRNARAKIAIRADDLLDRSITYLGELVARGSEL